MTIWLCLFLCRFLQNCNTVSGNKNSQMNKVSIWLKLSVIN